MTKVPLIDSTDATVWADAAMKVQWAESEEEHREILVGWFANAIAAGQKLAGPCGECGRANDEYERLESKLTGACQALESAERELKRNAATWIALEPILSAHVYEYAPRGDGHVWTAYTRFARPEQALAVAEKVRAALAGVSHGE